MGESVADEEITNNDQPEKVESTTSVIAAICGNIGVAIVKFIASQVSGSSALFSEAIHSLVDCGNGILILVGLRKARRAPDFNHPFGSGKELYFYTLIVSLAIFLLGGVVAVVEGVNAINEALAGTLTPGNPLVGYIVIIAAALIEGTSLRVALKNFNKARGDVGPIAFIRAAKDPSLYTVVLEDSAAELGLLFALVGTVVTQFTGNCVFDGAASILIGLLLCSVSVLLLSETKGLLVGEGVSAEEVDLMREIAEQDPLVRECGTVLTQYMGPRALIVAMDISLANGVSPQQVDRITDDIETRIRQRWPEASSVFIEIESLSVVLHEQEVQDAWED